MKTQARNLFYSPLEVSTLGSEYLKQRQDHKEFGVPFFSQKMRNRVYPMFPGELMSVIARPGHGKTSVMMFWARQRAKFLAQSNFKNRAVIYATWEQSIEELHSFYIAAEQQLSITRMAKGELTEEDWKKIHQASSDRINEPLWFVGHSMQRRSGRKPMTVETLWESVEEVRRYGEGFEVDCVFTDYVQRIAPEKGVENPVVAYTGILDSLKNMALGLAVPVIAGVQAKREVDDLNPPIPDQQHGQWTSNIEQSSDRIISLVRPRRYVKEGEMFGSRRIMGHRDLLVTVTKQKLGEANFCEWLLFNPMYNRLDENELVNPVPDVREMEVE